MIVPGNAWLQGLSLAPGRASMSVALEGRVRAHSGDLMTAAPGVLFGTLHGGSAVHALDVLLGPLLGISGEAPLEVLFPPVCSRALQK